MNKTKNFDEYFSSFNNGFELNKDGDTSLSNISLNTTEYMDSDIYSKPSAMLMKSLSWSSIEPSIASERNSYLIPYACQYNNAKSTASYQRPRCATMPLESSPRYLCVDGRNPFQDPQHSSDTRSPDISVIFENGHSKKILSEETSSLPNADTNKNEVENTKKDN